MLHSIAQILLYWFAQILDVLTQFAEVCRENLGKVLVCREWKKAAEHCSIARVTIDLKSQLRTTKTTVKMKLTQNRISEVILNNYFSADNWWRLVPSK